jgi:light-regulated signal transduction histidine kinase (bacteriophytochrome)
MALEKTNEQCQAELYKCQKEFEDFLYIVSHDFKSPIRDIKNLCEWIEEDFGEQVPDEAMKNLEIISNTAKKMEKMMSGLLELSRLGRMNPCIEPFNIGQESKNIIEQMNSPKKVSFRVLQEVPEFVTDHTLIKQVLGHLIDNAIKFNDDEHPKVELSARETGGFIEISVSDNGSGIAPEHHEKVFGIFSSLIPQSQMENTGMGLPIVKKIVENCGGTIELESGANQGATVRFFWPKNMEFK